MRCLTCLDIYSDYNYACFRLYTYAPRPGHGPETHQHRGARAPHGVLVHVPPSSFDVTLEGGDTGVGDTGDLAL